MNPRQRILAALAHKEPDCLPIDFGGMRSTGINTLAYVRLKKHLGIKTGQVRVYDLFQQLAEPEETVLKRMGGDVLQLHRLAPSFGIPIDEWKESSLADGSPCLVPAGFDPVRLPNNDLGIFKGDTLIAKMPAKGYYFDLVNFPYAGCRSKQDIDRIPLMEISSRELDFLAANARSLFEKTDYALLGAFGGNILEAGQSAFGFEKFMYMMAAEPDLVHHFFQKLTEAYLRDLEKYLAAVGRYLQVVQMGDDLGMQNGPQISRAMYREMVKPYHQALYQYIRKHSQAAVFLHCCGGVYELLPDLIEAGVQVLNPVQISARGMDPARLKKEFGKDLVFWGGGANMQQTVPSGTLEQIREETKRLIEIFAPGGGYVFTQVHNIQADVPPEKIMAIYDTALEFRKQA